jgi:hypothetical protein
MKKLLLLITLGTFWMQTGLQAAQQPTAKELRARLLIDSEELPKSWRSPLPLARRAPRKEHAIVIPGTEGLLADLRAEHAPAPTSGDECYSDSDSDSEAAVAAPAPVRSAVTTTTVAPQAHAPKSAYRHASNRARTPHNYKNGDIITGTIVSINPLNPTKNFDVKGIRIVLTDRHKGFIKWDEIPDAKRGPLFTPACHHSLSQTTYKEGQMLRARVIKITETGAIQLSLKGLPIA